MTTRLGGGSDFLQDGTGGEGLVALVDLSHNLLLPAWRYFLRANVQSRVDYR